jgi:hypothetical protein
MVSFVADPVADETQPSQSLADQLAPGGSSSFPNHHP